jgi:hypothetical protein
VVARVTAATPGQKSTASTVVILGLKYFNNNHPEATILTSVFLFRKKSLPQIFAYRVEINGFAGLRDVPANGILTLAKHVFSFGEQRASKSGLDQSEPFYFARFA